MGRKIILNSVWAIGVAAFALFFVWVVAQYFIYHGVL